MKGGHGIRAVARWSLSISSRRPFRLQHRISLAVPLAILATLFGLLPTTASAFVGGETPSLLVRHTVFGDGFGVGNTLMENDGTQNFQLRPLGSQQTVPDFRLPPDGEVVRAFLFWSGSTDPVFGTDRDVDFTLPNGQFFNDLSVDTPVAGEPPSALNRCTSIASAGNTPVGFFACRREVTTLLQNLGPGGAAGTYTVNGVDALAGNCAVDPFCQAAYAGWALVVVWESPTESVRRDVALYDAFLAVDEQDGPFSTGISAFFNLDNFLVGGDGEGELTFMGFEGDAQLGTPPQDSPLINPPQNFCPTCADFIELRSTSGGGTSRLTDPNNAAGNVFNGSNNTSGGPHPGLDIDSFDIGASGSGILSVGDTSIDLRVGSGDGVPGGQAGGGELVFLGFTLLTLDTLSPRFNNANTEKQVDNALIGPGETLTYTLSVFNDGSAAATNTTLRDQLPANVNYVPNSTATSCGVASPDIGGTSQLLRPQGLNLGTLGLNAGCDVTFQVTVGAATPDGTVLNNFFTVAADSVDALTVGPATSVVEGLQLATPTKAVSVLGGGPASPGASLVYTIRITNEGGRDGTDLTITDTLPAELEFVSNLAVPPGAAAVSAGQTIQVTGVDVDAGEFVEYTFAARIRPATGAGTVILNQATIDAGADILLTDDPNLGGAQDPTTIVVESDVNLGTSTKTVVIDGGGLAEPGGTLTYTINIRQTGAAGEIVLLNDDLPNFVGGCQVLSTPPGGFANCAPGGVNGTGLLTGAATLAPGGTATVVFRVTIDAAAPDGALITNAAQLVPQSDPAGTFTATSPSVEVFARPLLTASTKTVTDLNGGDLRPGDTVRYTIVVDNSGSVAAQNLTVEDTLPADLSFVSATAGGTAAGQTVSWTVPVLAVDASTTLTVDATVRAGTPNGTVLSNVADLQADAPAEPFTTPPAVITVVASPTLVVQKTVVDTGPAPFRPTDVVEYTITIENTGDGVATNVEARDAIDPNFAETLLTAGGRIEGGQVVFDGTTVAGLTGLAPGATETLVFQARLASSIPNGTVVSNQAFVTSDEGAAAVPSDDPGTAAPNDPTDFSIVSQANVSMTKVFIDQNGGATLPGERVEVRLTLENTGDAPGTNITVNDPLDARLTFVSSATGGTLVGNAVVFNAAGEPGLTALDAGDVVELTFLADLDFPLADGTLIPNQATAQSAAFADIVSDDPATPPLNDPTVLRVESRPVFDDATKAVVDIDGDGVFEPQDRVRYTIVIENTGSENATNVVVTDPIPAGLVDIVPEAGGTVVGGNIVWNGASNPTLTTVDVGERITLAFQAEIDRPLANAFVIDNQATISGDNVVATPTDDPATAAIDDPTQIIVTSHPRLVVEKTVLDGNGGAVEPGDTLLYTIRIRNEGDRAATNVVVRDPIDVSLTNIVADNGGGLDAGELTWTSATTAGLATLNIDQQIVLGFTATVRSPLANGTLILNQAELTTDDATVPGQPFLSDDPTTPAPADATIVQVVSAANLTTSTLESFDTVGAPIESASPADLIRYGVVLANTGNETATNVVVTVPVPPELQAEAAPGGIIGPGVVTFTAATTPALASLAPGETISLTFDARVVFPLDNGAVISVQAQLLADGVVAPFTTDDPSTAAFGDATLVTVVSQVDLSAFDKTVADTGAAPFEPGDIVQYTLVVRNTGDAPARDVVVRDPVPPELEFVSSTTGGVLIGGEVVFTSGQEPDLAVVSPGDPDVILRFEARIRANVTAGTVVANQAVLQPIGGTPENSDDPATGAVDDATRFSVVTVPRLTLTKDLNGPNGRIFAPGEVATYTFVLTSSGTGATGAMDFLDLVPAPLVSVTTTGGLAFNAGTRTATASVASLSPGEAVTFTLSGTIAEGTPNGTRLENQAQVQGVDIGLVQSDDPTTPAETDPTIGIVEATPVLVVTKTFFDENAGTILPGDIGRIDIAIRNDGNGRADDVQIRDVLDADFEIVEVLDGGAVTLNAVTWTQDQTPALASIVPGAETTVRVRVRVRSTVEDGTAISNQAEVNSPDLEAQVLSDNPATPAPNDPTIIVIAAPRLVFEKRFNNLDGDAILRPGASIRYDLVVRNEGSAPATNVVITDVVPLELTAPVAGQGGTIAGGQASWTEATTPALGVVAIGSEVVVTLSGTVDPLAIGGTVLRNQAEVAADQVGIPVRSDDPTTPAEDDATVRTIEAEESFSGEVALFDVETNLPIIAPVIPNQRVRAVVTFRNDGTQTAQAVVLRIPFAAARFNLDTASLGGIVDATEVRWTASQDDAFRLMAPGDEIEVVVEGAIASPIPDGSTIDVLATAESVSNQGEIWTFGPAQLTVRSRPDLSATTKEVVDENGGLVEPGDILTYRITVINAGGAEASNVVVHDPTPAGTEYVGGSAQLRGEDVADDNGTNPFANGLAIGDVPAGRSAVIRFQARVVLASLRGVRIENQATLRADNASDAVSDNPATPLVVGDATTVIVGGGPLLVASKIATPSSVALGSDVTFSIAVENGGSDLAREIEINDVIRQSGAYVANSVLIDGVAFTDAADGDPVTVTPTADGSEMRITRDVLEAGEGFEVTYRVNAVGPGALRNQATVRSATVPQFNSDADPSVPGAQETVVPLRGTRAILIDTDAMELRDASGGLLEAGDTVSGRAVIRNRSEEAVTLSNVVVDVSVGLIVTPADVDDPRFEVINTPTTQVRQRAGEVLTIEAGESLTVPFRGTVVDTAARGDPVRAAGSLTATTIDGTVAEAVDLGRAELIVGLMPGTAAREGTIFLDNGDRNDSFDPAPTGDGDQRASGFQVLAFLSGQSDSEPVKTSVTDETGRYEMSPLPAGNYRFEIRSASGAMFREVDVGAIQGGTSEREAHLRIDPSGAIYNAITFDAVRNQRVFLYVDDGDEDLTNDVLVPEADLLPGQQGQVTTTQGLYRFDPLAGDYRIGIETSSQLLSWPSTEIPFEGENTGHPLGSVAEPATDGTIVGHPIPNAALDRTYFLRFSLAEDRPPVLNNHIPVDSLRDQVRIQKTANRRKLTIGDIVTYTVRIENRAESGITFGEGGVEVVDTLPQGFRLIDDAWRVDRLDTDAIGQQRRVALSNVSVSGRRVLTFGAFPLLGRTTYELRYQVVVGPGTRFGNADNRAELRSALGDVPITEQALARVEVIADQTFDLGSLRAKVFCDDNSDGVQNPGELGVAGARLYLDTGFYADADLYGKLHFTAIPPGTHLVKMDERTLPPGTTLIGDTRQNFYISRGLPAQVTYRAKCQFVTLDTPTIALNEAVYRGPGKATPPVRNVAIEGALNTGELILDGTVLPPLTVDLGVNEKGSEPLFGGAPGPNLGGPTPEGTLPGPLVFTPRADTSRDIVAWQLTVQRDRAGKPGIAEGASANTDAGPALADAGTASPARDSVVGDTSDGAIRNMLRGMNAFSSSDAFEDAGVGETIADAGVPATDAGPVVLDETIAESESLYVFAGEGPPPNRIEWDGKGPDGSQLLQAGERYSAVFSTVVAGGDEGYSEARPFAVAYGEPIGPPPPPAYRASLNASKGRLFSKSGKPLRQTRRFLDTVASELKALESGPKSVVVTVHSDSQPSAVVALTTKRALKIVEELEKRGVAAARLEPIGAGDSNPVRPNFSNRDRKANRRIEIEIKRKERPLAVVDLPRIGSEIRVNGEAVEQDATGRFAQTLEAKIGETVEIDVRGPGVGRRVVVRAVTLDGFRTLPDTKASGNKSSISGNFAERTAKLDDKDVSLDLLGVRLEPAFVDDVGRAIAPIEGVIDAVGGAELSLALSPKLPERDGSEWVKWSFRIFEPMDAGDDTPTPTGDVSSLRANAKGRVIQPSRLRLVTEREGTGLPPSPLMWAGEGQEGPRSARENVTYFARLVVEDSAGNVAISPDLPIVAGPKPAPVDAFSADVKNPATNAGRLKRSAKRTLRKLAKKLAKTEGPITIGAHLDNKVEADKAKAITEQTAAEALALLAKAGIASDRMTAVGFGSGAPIAPNITSRSRKRNRRLEIRITPPVAEAKPMSVTPRVLANGRALEIEEGRFAGDVPLSRSGEVTLMVKDVAGARALIRVRTNAPQVWQGLPEDVEAYVAERTQKASALSPATEGVESQADGGVQLASAPVSTRPLSTPAPTDAGVGAAEVALADTRADTLVPYAAGGDTPDWWPTWSQVPAADLQVQLPPENAPLKSTTLVVRGKTAPTNTITVMGEPVDVDPKTGAFVKRIDATRGKLLVNVTSTDVLGNTAKIERVYAVDPSGWFVMLFAEAAAGQDGAQLSERADTTSITLGDFFLYGRGVAYVKGDFTGDYVFKNYDLTFHADTRRWQDDVFARDVFDVDRFMPAYGDSSVEVQDAKAFYPIYLDLKADHSSARIGNLKTDLKGGDLFRYARSRYGASVEFDRGWANGAQVELKGDKVKITDPKSDPWRTTARVFGAGGAANTRHARIELMGTGGSIFFLRHEDILEGSERVAIIVRDGVTGAEIARQTKQRNVDYTIRYGEGRVVFKEPIPAFVDAGFTLNHNLGQVAAGHRVFIEVQYDHTTLEPFQGLAAGAQVEQTLFGHFTIGGGYVYEGREDGTPAYQLAGMHAKLFYDANTYIQAEWAWSQSVDAGNFLSLDGGLTYQSLGQSLDQKATQVGRIVFPAERQGLALKLEGQVAFGHIVGRNPLDGVVRVYAQYQSPGFFSGANIVEQGQTKWGLDANWSITDKDSIRLRYDSVLSEIPEIANVTEARSLQRHLATAGYSRQVFEGLRAGAELGYSYTFDSGAFGNGAAGTSSDVHTAIGALVVDWQLLESLSLSLKQEFILMGDERQLNAWNDHLVTHAQVRYALSERLSLNVTESIRWNGENLTQVGLSWKVNDKSKVYATERLGFGAAGWNNSTVIGGETEVVDGTRMYAEYQMTGAFSGPQTRGVMGLANKWKLPFGFTLNFGYERTQVIAGDSTAQGNSVIAPAAFTDGTFYAAPGANGGGNVLYGAGSRDAAYAGVEYRAGDAFSASQRFELRYDNFDESRGGADRLWAISMTNATWALSPELSLLARYNFALAQDISNARQEARMEEGTLGVAYRPVTHDWVSVWAKLSRRADVRPLSLKDGRFEDYTTHAASVEPIVELPFDIQLVEKLAFKHASQLVDDLPQADALTGLWINRVNWHVLRTLRRFDIDPIIPGDIDLGVEYRFLAGFTANTLEHGVLLEATIAPVEFFRMGVGWNFTRFSDNELARNDRDFSGFFIRAVGQY